ncbi:MAG: hypothetical protein K6G27_06170 [Lachnospiraceae bacterium]|nr:hypothetical protein [Lachnospiraceae bacterium]
MIKRLGMAPGTFSTYRQRLIKSGIILPEERGYVSLALPRFTKVAKYLERE